MERKEEGVDGTKEEFNELGIILPLLFGVDSVNEELMDVLREVFRCCLKLFPIVSLLDVVLLMVDGVLRP